jgi:hypothetical protein
VEFDAIVPCLGERRRWGGAWGRAWSLGHRRGPGWGSRSAAWLSAASRWSMVERGLVSRIFMRWALFALGGSRRLLDP